MNAKETRSMRQYGSFSNLAEMRQQGQQEQMHEKIPMMIIFQKITTLIYPSY